MVNQNAYSLENDENKFEQFYDEPDTVAYGDCCEEEKDRFMKMVKEEMQRGVSSKDGEMIIQALNVYKIPCKDFAELLEKLSSMTGGSDAVVQVNNISSRYFRIDKLPTRMLSGIANLIKRAAVEASTTYRNCKAMKKSWDIIRRE